MQVPARELQAMNCHGVKAQPHKLQEEKSQDFTDKDTSHGKGSSCILEKYHYSLDL